MNLEDLPEVYYRWLVSDCMDADTLSQYDGVLRELHDIPFYWVKWSDENRSGDALAFRQYEFMHFAEDLDRLDPVDLGNWAMAAPSVLEVLVGIARRWHCYFDELELHVFFHHLFVNLGLHVYPGVKLAAGTREVIREKIDNWLSYNFPPDGAGTPFPVRDALPTLDLRKTDIFGQMNAYSAEHFQ